MKATLGLVASLLAAGLPAALSSGRADADAPPRAPAHVEELRLRLGGVLADPSHPEHAAARAELDRACAQRDCWASGLFWHTDLEAAKRAAAESGRPILSLRLLGRLDEELSCANSRLFRALLYSDPEVSRLLRERWVLHWSSERPAPVATIDFGDGRRLRTTVTGNSVHHALDRDGRPVDALPGLYAPAAFRAALVEIEPLARAAGGLDEEARARRLVAWHAPRATFTPPSPPAVRRDAADAMMAAPSKMAIEAPLVRGLAGESRWVRRVPASLAPALEVDTTLAPEALEVMRRQNPALAEDAFARMVARLRESLARDTTFNEVALRPRLHAWLADRPATGLEELDRRVYDELFLTPASDPWLGLLPEETFTGLPGGGVLESGGAGRQP